MFKVFIFFNEFLLKTMRNALYFETFWLCRKTASYESYKVNFKIYDVIDWTTDNHNSYIALYLKK